MRRFDCLFFFVFLVGGGGGGLFSSQTVPSRPARRHDDSGVLQHFGV